MVVVALLLRGAHAQRERVQELMTQNTPFALMSLKLDSFRLINDNFGPSFGNAIISAAAGVIAQAVGKSGELSRADGAEFTVIAVDMVDKELLKDRSNRSQHLFRHLHWHLPVSYRCREFG